MWDLEVRDVNSGDLVNTLTCVKLYRMRVLKYDEVCCHQVMNVLKIMCVERNGSVLPNLIRVGITHNILHKNNQQEPTP